MRAYSLPPLSGPNLSFSNLPWLRRAKPSSNSHLPLSPKNPILRRIHVAKSSAIHDSGGSEYTHAKETELELLEKPSPIPIDEEEEKEESSTTRKQPELEEALAPFLRFFKTRDSAEEAKVREESDAEVKVEEMQKIEESKKEVAFEYYDPKPGDFVVGVVVSGNENKLDINIGANELGMMLTKEVLPLYDEELPYLLCDIGKDTGEFMVSGKVGIVKDEEALNRGKVAGGATVEPGTVLFAEVLGRTLSGRPLLSSRRMFRRVAWHRVRQIMQLNEPIKVKIFEWNTGGLLTRIEGLRAFLPKAELMNKVKNFTDLKSNVGRLIHICITRIDEATNDLIISEKEAWDMMHLKEGTLLRGTIRKIFPYGAQVRIGDSNRSGLLHISNITSSRVTSVNEILKVDEEVKVLVVKSMFPDKIALSIADLESEPGLFLSDREKVFSEAEGMAKKYRQRLPVISATRNPDPLLKDALPFDKEPMLYSNWKWFKFEQLNEVNSNGNTES